MQVHVNAPRIFEKKMYRKGAHEMPDHLMNDWFFKAQVAEGICSVIPKAEKAEGAPQMKASAASSKKA